MAFGITLTVLGILFVVIILPIWIVAHYATRWRAARALGADDERRLAELWELASKFEARIEGLEKAVGLETPPRGTASAAGDDPRRQH